MGSFYRSFVLLAIERALAPPPSQAGGLTSGTWRDELPLVAFLISTYSGFSITYGLIRLPLIWLRKIGAGFFERSS